VAIKATAYKLAKLIFLVLTKGWEYVEQGIAKYEERVRLMRFNALQKLAKELDFVVIPKAMLKA